MDKDKTLFVRFSNLYILKKYFRLIFIYLKISYSIKKLPLKMLSLVLVVDCILDKSRWNYRIGLSFGILYRSRKSKDKLVNQSHPTTIVKIKAFFVFLRKSKIAILVSNSAHKSLLIILITFFDRPCIGFFETRAGGPRTVTRSVLGLRIQGTLYRGILLNTDTN